MSTPHEAAFRGSATLWQYFYSISGGIDVANKHFNRFFTAFQHEHFPSAVHKLSS